MSYQTNVEITCDGCAKTLVHHASSPEVAEEKLDEIDHDVDHRTAVRGPSHDERQEHYCEACQIEGVDGWSDEAHRRRLEWEAYKTRREIRESHRKADHKEAA